MRARTIIAAALVLALLVVVDLRGHEVRSGAPQADEEGVTTAVVLKAAGPPRAHSVTGFASHTLGLPVHFVENRGQLDPRVDFEVWEGSTRAWLTQDGIVLALRAPTTGAAEQSASATPPAVLSGTIALTFEGADPNTTPVGEVAAAARFNVFHGSDPARWVTGIPSFHAVRYRALYRGVDVVVHESAGELEYDLDLLPGASLAGVLVRVEGGCGLHIDTSGSLVIDTPVGPVIQPRPTTVAIDGDGRRRPVDCHYEIIDATHVRFRTEGWDGASRLAIDPSLIFSTYVGGSITEFEDAVAVDDDGSVVAVGSTESPDFPLTVGAFDTVMAGGSEGTVIRLSPSGGELESATFIGGAGSADEPMFLRFDRGRNVVVGGYTSSPDFPTTPGAYSTILDGPTDIFVSKFTPDGASLVFSTLIGGGCADTPTGMALDSSDRIYFSVDTHFYLCGSPTYPTTPNAICALPGDTDEVNITRLSADGTTLEFSSFICAVGGQNARDIACDDFGHAFLVGQTGGPAGALPVTPGVFDTTYNGDSDLFVVKVDCDAGVLDWCTYLGGYSTELYGNIAVNAAGEVYVTGQTWSFNFPSTPDSFNPYFTGTSDTFLLKLTADGSDLVYGGFIGGNGDEEPHGLALDAAGNAYVTGFTTGSPTSFPLTPDAVQPTMNGKTDAFLCKVSADGKKLLYSTLLGGSKPPADAFVLSYGISVGHDGSVAITGYTPETDYPTTPGAFDTHLDGFSDAFVARFDLSPWSAVGQGVAGAGNEPAPKLAGSGTLQPGSAGVLMLSGALPTAGSALVVGLSAINAPFKGGTLVPAPLLVLPLTTDGSGAAQIPWAAWPAGIPAGTKIYMQTWVHDPAGPHGWTASNGLLAWTPVIEN